MNDLERRVYDLLKSHGHSPAKAAEIVLDISRGDTVALMWANAAGAAQSDLARIAGVTTS